MDSHGDTGTPTQGNRAWGHSRDTEEPWSNQSLPVPPLAVTTASLARPSAPSTWQMWSGHSRVPSLSPVGPPGPRCPRTGSLSPGSPPPHSGTPPGCRRHRVPTPAVPQAGLLRRDGTRCRCCHLWGLPRRDAGVRQGAPAAARRREPRGRAAPLHPHRHQVQGQGGLGDRVASGMGWICGWSGLGDREWLTE